MSLSPSTILCCPNCKATEEEGFNFKQLNCQRCKANFFELSGMPCLFAAGEYQKEFWQHLLAQFIESAEQAKTLHLTEFNTLGISKRTRKRLSEQQKTREHRQQSVVKTLKRAGLKPVKSPKFGETDARGFSQYYDYILRDWAWEQAKPPAADTYRSYQNENTVSAQLCLKALGHVPSQPIGSVLVLGSGAGRLSWDIHSCLKPEQTIAVDNNPLLAFVSHAMIKNMTLDEFFEERVCPREGIPELCSWSLSSNSIDEQLATTWSVVAADAWDLPFQNAQFDVVVTPWFVDVCGKDFKNLQGMIDRLLKPSGVWLNHGPLLYLENTPNAQRYVPEEIREILQRGKFSLLSESFDALPYSHSPLSERGRVEDCWTFLAESAPDKNHLERAESFTQRPNNQSPPDWLFLPYIPIPDLRGSGLFPEELQNIELLLDGTRSINDLKQFFIGKLPEGHEPEQFVEGLLRDFIIKP